MKDLCILNGGDMLGYIGGKEDQPWLEIQRKPNALLFFLTLSHQRSYSFPLSSTRLSLDGLEIVLEINLHNFWHLWLFISITIDHFLLILILLISIMYSILEKFICY